MGELMVTPFNLLSNTLREIDRIVTVCKEHEVWVMEIVPRFLLKACCEDVLHCLNVRGNDSGAINAARKILDDLSGLNGRIGDYMAVNAAKMVSTVDLLTGVHSATAPDGRPLRVLEQRPCAWGQNSVFQDCARSPGFA